MRNLVRRSFVRVSDHIGPVSEHTGNSGMRRLQRDIRRVVDCEGRAGVHGEQSIELPAIQERTGDTCECARERNGVGHAPGKTIARIEERASVFSFQIQVVLGYVELPKDEPGSGTGHMKA